MHASKAKCLHDVTAVYRILDNSASHFKSFRKKAAFGISAIQVRRHYAEQYKFDDIATELRRREMKSTLLLDLYNLNILKFCMSRPWKYGVTFRNAYRIIKKRLYDKAN